MSVFQKVPSLRPARSVFDLSYDKKFTCDFGQLIPVFCEEMVPGDKFQIANNIVIRFQPLMAPILHEVNCYVHYFFVAKRNMWDDFEDFITGGEDGTYEASPPLWCDQLVPDDDQSRRRRLIYSQHPPHNGYSDSYMLWDYLGFPVGVDVDRLERDDMPDAFGKIAYNMVWNEYYRDQNLQDEVDLMNDDVLLRNWEKDYFTSSLPWQQRGQAPALPVVGTDSVATWPSDSFMALPTGTAAALGFHNTVPTDRFAIGDMSNDVYKQNILNALNRNVVHGEFAATFNVSDLRLAFQIQKWMERNARTGSRYIEFLRAHFAVSPRDDRLQRPEYIGGTKSPVIISEVLQTSSSDATTPQGHLAGHGITADGNFVGSYYAQEFGVIIGILSVMPRTAYQQGIDRQWLRRSRFDYPFPEFVNLSEQAVELRELYLSENAAVNSRIHGYIPRFDEMRIKRSMVCADLRESPFDVWHLGRKFDAPPNLNSDFIQCDPNAGLKRVFANPSAHGLIINYSNKVRAVRPIPYLASPGLIDHN